jgi:hypothetical protein
VRVSSATGGLLRVSLGLAIGFDFAAVEAHSRPGESEEPSGAGIVEWLGSEFLVSRALSTNAHHAAEYLPLITPP